MISSLSSICDKSGKLNGDNRDDTDVGCVPHITGQLNNDLYAVPVKRRPQKSPEDRADSGSTPDKERSDDDYLPPGWEKHEGEFILHKDQVQCFITCLFCSQTMMVRIIGT